MLFVLSFIFPGNFSYQDLPAISIKEVKTSDGAICLQLSVPSRTRVRDGFWNFLARFGFRYGGGTCRTLLPLEVSFFHISVEELLLVNFYSMFFPLVLSFQPISSLKGPCQQQTEPALGLFILTVCLGCYL